jgi:hypothetical protein
MTPLRQFDPSVDPEVVHHTRVPRIYIHLPITDVKLKMLVFKDLQQEFTQHDLDLDNPLGTKSFSESHKRIGPGIYIDQTEVADHTCVLWDAFSKEGFLLLSSSVDRVLCEAGSEAEAHRLAMYRVEQAQQVPVASASNDLDNTDLDNTDLDNTDLDNTDLDNTDLDEDIQPVEERSEIGGIGFAGTSDPSPDNGSSTRIPQTC